VGVVCEDEGVAFDCFICGGLVVVSHDVRRRQEGQEG
jgi:hypothetical protein